MAYTPAEHEQKISPRVQRRSSEALRPGTRSILVPVDDAEECALAIQWALANVLKPGDIFHLFHIIPQSQGAFSGAFTAPTKHQSELQWDQAQSFISERFVPLVEQAGAEYKVDIVRGSTDRQSIGEAICNRASDLAAALVVMAAHNRGALMRFIVGSTTQYCIEHCEHTVMVMHRD